MKENSEFLNIIEEIINNEEFLKRKEYLHHENESVYEHCLKVSYYSFLYAKKHNMNTKDITIGALLHDFYYKPWQENTEKKKFFKKHGFVHAKEALENSKKYFPNLINEKIEDIIVKHMFPLNIKFPKYKESWIVTYYDKKCSLNILKSPKIYTKYLGFKRKKVKNGTN